MGNAITIFNVPSFLYDSLDGNAYYYMGLTFLYTDYLMASSYLQGALVIYQKEANKDEN